MPSLSTVPIRLLIIVLAVLAVAANAQGVPDLELSSASSAGGCLLICPAGDGQTLAGAGATIDVTLLDTQGDVIFLYPAEDIWADAINLGDLTFCDAAFTADSATDQFGMTTISGTASGGGHTSGLYVYVAGAPMTNSPLDITIVSPDINGDLTVDTCDLTLFANDIGGTYNYRSDFNCDLALNLTDTAILASHICHKCPGGAPYGNIDHQGSIGVFFDTAGTQTGILGVPVGSIFNFYVVALSAPGGISGYEFRVYVDPSSAIVLGETLYPLGATYDIAGGTEEVIAGIGGPCLPATGPVLLADFLALNLAPLMAPICLTGASATCLPDDSDPAYIECGQCVWHYFDRAYEGCAIINGLGPVSVEARSWSAIKGLYDD